MKRTYIGWLMILLAFCSPAIVILYAYCASRMGAMAWHIPVIAALLGGGVGIFCGYVGLHLLDPDNFRPEEIEMFGPLPSSSPGLEVNASNDSHAKKSRD